MTKDWTKVGKKEFDILLKKQKVLIAHTVTICEPWQVLYWNSNPKPNEDRSFGQGAFAKKIPAWMGCRAEYYVRATKRKS